MPDYLTPLDRHALEALGIEGFAYGYIDRVRFHELDALNHVNNVTYLRWFETIRVNYSKDYGVSTYESEDDPQMVVRRVTADYFAPVLAHQDYVVTARTVLVKPSSYLMEYGIFVDCTLAASGEAVCVSLTPGGTGRQNHRPEAVQMMVERDGAKTEGF